MTIDSKRSFILRGIDDHCRDSVAKCLDKIAGQSDVNYRLYKRAREHYCASPDGSIFLILTINNTRVNVIVELLWWQWLSSTQGFNARVHFYPKSKDRRGKGGNTHTGLKIRYPWFNKSETESGWHTVETSWSKDGPRLKSDNMRWGYRIQDRVAVQRRSGSRQHVVSQMREWVGTGRSNGWRPTRPGRREIEKFIIRQPPMREGGRGDGT